MDPPFHQLRQTSRARAHGVHHWTLNVWVGECPTYGPSHTSFLTERLFGHKAPWASYHCHGHFWHCTFQKESNSTHWGTQFSLSWWISDNMCSTSGSSALSVTASHEDTGQNLFWREKISFHTPKPKSPGQGHHGKTEEEPPMSCLFNRKGVFQLGKIEGIIYIEPHLVSIEKTWVPNREDCLQPTYF